MEKKYIKTPVYASQLSEAQKGEKADYRFMKIKADNLLKNDGFVSQHGKYTSASIIVPEFFIKGAVMAKEVEKNYNLDFAEGENTPVAFDPLVLDENRKRVGGKHVLAQISIPESDAPFKVMLSRVKPEAKGKEQLTKEDYEQKTIEISNDGLRQLFDENRVAVISQIKKFKAKLTAENFKNFSQEQEAEAALFFEEENKQELTR